MLIKNKWLYHILLWVTVILLGFITDYGTGGWEYLSYTFSLEGMRIDGVFYIASIFIYFVNFKYICSRFLSRKKALYFIIGFIGLLFLFVGTRFFLDEVVFKFLTGKNNYTEKYLIFSFYFFDNIQYAIRAILYSTVIYLVFQFIEVQNQMVELQLNHKKAELSFLKSQISPHFLFNTLNTFYSEIVEIQPKIASDIHRLAKLLRFVIYKSEVEFVELRQEIDFIEDYIYFYKKRYESELSLNYQLIGELNNQTVASLVLIHFVENVFKHGVLNEIENPVTIKICIEEEAISIKTYNKIEQSAKYMGSGIGMENLKKRLDAIYHNSYELNYTEKNNFFSASLKILI